SELEQAVGLRLQEDVLASLGEVWTVSMTPLDSWLGTTVTVEVRDRAKIATLLANIEKLFATMPAERRPPRIESSAFGEHIIQILAMPGLPQRPAWCLTADRLIVAPSPQAIKTHLSAKASEVGLFNQPALAGAFAGEGRLLSVSYQDTAKLFESSLSMVSMLAPFMMEAINDTNRRRGLPAAQPPFDFATLPSARSIHRHLLPGVTFTRRMPDGLETESHQTIPLPNVGASAPVAVALLLPAVQAAREASRRMQSANNLKQLTLAMHNYEAAFRQLPPAYTVDKKGKPLLSWRVLILPFLDELPLYDQFKLDEPWDSEHNKKLIDKMPQVLKSPQGIAGPGMTLYLGVAGKGGIMGKPEIDDTGKAQGISFAPIVDGTSNTVMIVECNNPGAVVWSKPGDYIPDPKDPTKNLLGLYPGGFSAAFADGSVQFLSDKMEPQMLMNLFQMNDGNAVNIQRR
ncbi:MAG TPA: DUF1559 domain-containing protein, partial [Pirellulaceae bacterium]|nr:DUF1559 domain-containing protein [Pirellulaceae bacterium]